METATDKDFQVALCELQVSGLIDFMPEMQKLFFSRRRAGATVRG